MEENDYDKLNRLADKFYKGADLRGWRQTWNQETANLKVDHKACRFVDKVDRKLAKLIKILEDGY